MNFKKTAVFGILASMLVSNSMVSKGAELGKYENVNISNLVALNSPSYFKESLNNNYEFESVEIIASKPIKIGVNNTKVYTDAIESYAEEQESPSWDDVGKIETLTMCYNFLVYDKGLPSELVSGILGNVMCEGDFGYREGYYNGTQNYNQVINALNGSGGVGIIQWTYYTKKNELKKYYVDTFSKVSGYDFKVKCAIAELTYLYDMIKNEGFLDRFSNLNGTGDSLVHNACGMFACEYERYAGYSKQWLKSPNSYKCININSNGGKRLKYALKIYHHFNDGIVG